MRPAYPELMESAARVARIVKDEEHRYATTFLVAEKVFQDEIKNLSGFLIPGALSFKLYDTYGLALDEQEEMARERGLTIDRTGFEQEMDRQRERARASWKGAAKGVAAPAYERLLERGRTQFLGYQELNAVSRVTGLLAGASLPVSYELITDEYCCTWIVLPGDLQPTVTAVITACRLLNEARRGGAILCVAFEFGIDDRKSYWIYNRRDAFYPFVPQGNEHDVMRELRMQHAGTDILPVEDNLARWYPIWGMPF
jgi:hypothetical protein